MKVLRTENYERRLNEIFEYIYLRNELDAWEFIMSIDDQVEKLSDNNFPHRIGRVPGTRELVADKNYIVLLRKNAEEIVAFDILHSAQKFP
jgi:toxin ParE1/3/4